MPPLRKSLLLLVAIVTMLAFGRGSSAKGKPVSWKGIDDALLRVNDNPVKVWGVFQAGNKRDPLVLQMGNRFLLIKIHDKQIFEIDPSKVQVKADEILWDPSDHPADPLATSDWEAADGEAVFRIKAKVIKDDGLLDIELPHQLDLSGMSPHAQSNSRRR
jgi:hypothetical protein